jgi:hypothetical protein
MNRSSFYLYRAPFLDADAIDGSDGSLTLVRQDRSLSLEVSGDRDAALALLRGMTNPSGLRGVLNNGLDLETLAILDQLDHGGWIRDADDRSAAVYNHECALLTSLVERWTAWIETNGSCGWDELVSIGGDSVPKALNVLLGPLEKSDVTFERSVLPGVVVGLNRIPLVKAFIRSIRDSKRGASDFLRLAERATIEDCDVLEIERVIWALACLSIRADVSESYVTWPRGLMKEVKGGSGLAIIHQAEECLEAMLQSFRQTLLTGIDCSGSPKRFAANVFLHQYYMTTRYLQSLSALLVPGRRASLLAAGFRYLVDEVGHDIHEREACIALGIADSDIELFSPLPLFCTYPLLLDILAQEDPLSFCLCVMLSEGLPGTRKPILDRLRRRGLDHPVFKAHQEIDEDHDHSLICRGLVAAYPYVSAERARLSIHRFLAAAEFSQRCWVEVAAYSMSADLPLVPRAFSLDKSVIIALGGNGKPGFLST